MEPLGDPPAPRPARVAGTLSDSLLRPVTGTPTAALVFIPALVALLLGGCGHRERHAAPEAAAVAIAVESVSGTGTSAGMVVPARVKARDEVTLTARMAGRVTALPALEGAHVRAGQTVVVFDAPEAARALAAARSERDAARTALGLAERDAERADSLFARGVIAVRERERAGSDRESAAARLESAEATLAQIGEATTVRAPFDGVVARRHVDVGADLAPGAAMLDLRSTGTPDVVAPVPESAVASLAAGSLAVQIGDGPWRAARLTRLDGMTDFVSRTRTAHLAPLDATGLVPGDFARVRIAGPGPGDAAAAPSVSRAALVTRGGLTGVYVVEGDRAWLRWIKPGRVVGERQEVLAGLSPGEQVARAPDALHDGARVTVRP